MKFEIFQNALFFLQEMLITKLLGLLARGLSAIAPRGGLEGWRWIFIIEGLIASSPLI